MGNVRTAQIKKMAKDIVRNFHDQLNLDFQNNKHVVEEVCSPMSKRLRNRIAGYVTRIMRKFQEQTIQVLEEL